MDNNRKKMALVHKRISVLGLIDLFLFSCTTCHRPGIFNEVDELRSAAVHGGPPVGDS